MSPADHTADHAAEHRAHRAAPSARFLARALPAARANSAWPDLRALAGFAALFDPARHGGLLPPLAHDAHTGLPPYEAWARLWADHAVALAEGVQLDDIGALAARALGSPVHAMRLARRKYNDALRALPSLVLGELKVAVRRDHEKGARSVHAMLDKVEADGQLVRLTVDARLAKSVTDKRVRELLFSLASQPVELVLVQLLEERGVEQVERVARGAVDACSVVEAHVRSDLLACIDGLAGAAACSFSFSTCALDVTAGDNDPFSRPAHASLGKLPHKLFRDRKLVCTRAARTALEGACKQRGCKTIVYEIREEDG